MTEAVVAFNAGSSSLKFSLFPAKLPLEAHLRIYRGQIEDIGRRPHLMISDGAGRPVVDRRLSPDAGHPLGHEQALAMLFDWIEAHEAGLTLVAVGHRVVHGGDRPGPARASAELLDELDKLGPLAPLHQEHNLALIRALAGIKPALPQIVCFDTAFHLTQPKVASTFALPFQLSDAGIRRYGFHGISYEYIIHALSDVAGAPTADGRVIAAHLGNGASLCAMRNRKSIATTMGLTPLDGLVMGTRAGAIDPGVLLHLINDRGIEPKAVAEMLYFKSGLLGVSGVSSDMRDLLASKELRATFALDIFIYRLAREIGSLVAALGGLDALVFTAGIGENAAEIRARACKDLHWLGIRLDDEANRRNATKISPDGSAVSVWVIPTDEELMIARKTMEHLGPAKT